MTNLHLLSKLWTVLLFLAVLELIRLRQLVAVQEEDFGEIEIRRAAPLGAPEATPPPQDSVTVN